MSKKPDFTLPPMSGDNDLLTRLNTFLPQLSAANESLVAEIAATGNADAKNIEHVDEDEERYIEMNLGLGVLEEIHSSDSEPEEEKADPIAKALNPGAAKKKVGIQLVDEDAAPPHGVKRRASEDPSSSSESESESSSEESSSESEDEDAASGEDDLTAKRHGS